MDLDEQLTLAESVDIEEHKEINRQVEENRKAKQKRVDEFTAEQKELNGKLDELNDEKESEVAAAKQEVDLKISNTSLLYSKKKDEFKLEADNVKEGLRENVELRQEELNEHNAKYERFNNEISEWEREIQSTDVLKDEIDSLKSGICPFCKQEHVDEDKVKELETKLHSIRKKNDQLDADIKVNTLELEFIENNATLVHEELTESQTVLAKHIDNTDKILKSLRDEEQAMLDVLTEERGKKVNTIKRKYTKLEKEYNDQLEELSAIDFNVEFADMILESEYSDEDLAAIVKEIEMIKVHIKKEKETVNPYDKLLKEAEKELKDSEVDKTKLYELKETEEHYKILIKLLTENKSFVRKNLLDQYVPFLNQRIDHYAVQLGLPHEVIINNDLTTDITYMTHSVSYGNLSNGERGRLNFAVSMAFRDLLKASGHSFNVLLVDELLDNGIDTSGFHDIFKIVKKEVKGSLFIISHRDDLVTDVDNIMTVVKENGFTHIVETD
jgi:DNA repair exonuclease SbcCD ATPase subunit